jgi:hypothetical protein
MADSDKQVVNIGWLKDQGYSIKEAYTDNTWCPTFDNITASTIGSNIGVSATCYGTGAEYSATQVVCRKDVYSSYACTCGDLTLSSINLSWSYSEITGSSPTAKTVTITQNDCISNVSVESNDETLCTASLSEDTITITPKGGVGNASVIVNYTTGNEGDSCDKEISCVFDDMECDCSSISADPQTISWAYSDVTAKTVSSTTISIPSCLSGITPSVMVVDSSKCSAEWSSSNSKLNVTPVGVTGNTTIYLTYSYGIAGTCSKAIYCKFLNCSVEVDDIRISADTATESKEVMLNVDFVTNFKKLRLKFNDGTADYAKACNGNSSLSRYDYDSDKNRNVTEAEVGYCVKELNKYSLYGTFYWCENMTKVTLPDGLWKIGDDSFYHCSSLTSVTIPNSVYEIGSYCFRDDTNLISVNLPTGLRKLGRNAFEDCQNLTGGITIPAGVTKIEDEVFYGCSSLTSITLHSNITSIGNGAFEHCSGLTGSFTVPNSVTAIGREAFDRCQGLTAITLPSNSNFKKIEAYTFYECSHVTSLTVPSSVKKIGPSAFEKMWNLTSITLPTTLGIEGDEYSTQIMSHTFNQAVNLTSLTLPTNITAIGEWALHMCKKLTSLTIPATVKEIEWLGVSWCDELETITFAANSQLTKIDRSGFEHNKKLVSITFTATTPPSLGQNAFYDCNSLANIYVPSASVDAYKAASGWSSYADKIKAIP